MSYFQLYEANKAKYKQLKPESIWRHKDVSVIKLRIISTNSEDKVSLVKFLSSSQLVDAFSNSHILRNYEPFEDTLQ